MEGIIILVIFLLSIGIILFLCLAVATGRNSTKVVNAFTSNDPSSSKEVLNTAKRVILFLLGAFVVVVIWALLV